jgi:hypothetical protein
MMNVDTTSKKEQRKFGLVMAVAISVLGLIRYALHGFEHVPLAFFIVAAAFAVLGLVAPRVLQPVFWAWMKFALGINWVMTRVLLTVAFLFLIVPVRIILIVLRKDLLNRAWDSSASTYWEDAEEQPAEFDRYLNQF